MGIENDNYQEEGRAQSDRVDIALHVIYNFPDADMEIVAGTAGTPAEPFSQEWGTPVMTAGWS